jgi:hypothetical protein
MQVTIPEYLTLKQLTNFNKIKWMEGIELYIYTVHVITDISVDEVRKMPLTELKEVYLKCANLITNIDSKFYPVIEWEGKSYGYSHMKKMTAGEYADLDFLTLNTEQNITKIMSILYRPVVKNKLKSFTYKFKNTIKYWFDDVEEPFEYYTIEPYGTKSEINFDNFPAGVALGAMGFLLAVGNKSVVDTLISSHPHLPEVQTLVKMIIQKKKEKSQSKNIMGGLASSVTYVTPIYLSSMGTNQ